MSHQHPPREREPLPKITLLAGWLTMAATEHSEGWGGDASCPVRSRSDFQMADGLCLAVPSRAVRAPGLSMSHSLHEDSLSQSWHMSTTCSVNPGTAVESKFSGTILYQALDMSKGIRSLYTNLSCKWSHFLQNIRPDPTPTPAGPEHGAGEP